MKKINIISGILLVYLAVMAALGWPGRKPEPDYVQYFAVLGISLAAIFLLHFLRIRRMKLRKKWEKEKEAEK
jgi:cytochrome c biogenesis protein CcdA